MKRFKTLKNYSVPLVISSNIENIPNHAKIINYLSYLNNSKMLIM
jgi:hypothetical protein